MLRVALIYNSIWVYTLFHLNFSYNLRVWKNTRMMLWNWKSNFLQKQKMPVKPTCFAYVGRMDLSVRDAKCREAGLLREERLICQKCYDQVSVTAGTIFQDMHKPLTMWFRAVWHVNNRKLGASAVTLQKKLGLGSYKIVWAWPHKLCRGAPF